MLFGLASSVYSVCLYMVMGRELSAHTRNYRHASAIRTPDLSREGLALAGGCSGSCRASGVQLLKGSSAEQAHGHLLGASRNSYSGVDTPPEPFLIPARRIMERPLLPSRSRAAGCSQDYAAARNIFVFQYPLPLPEWNPHGCQPYLQNRYSNPIIS